jgi:hypothetical protein
MDKQLFILVLVVGLVILTGVQAYEISNLKEDMDSGELSSLSSTTGYSAATSNQPSAPTMVGGC